MIINDIPRPDLSVDHVVTPVGAYSFSQQPALAQANRQLRNEVLPIFFDMKKVFGFRIHLGPHKEAHVKWDKFLDHFGALVTGLNGISHITRVQKLKVELWHPGSAVLPRVMLGPLMGNLHNLRRNYNSRFPLHKPDVIYLEFGSPRGMHVERFGGANTDWADRAKVMKVLRAAIVRDQSLVGRWGPNILKIRRFCEEFPFRRLVELTMMIAAERQKECPHVVASFGATCAT
jgi:hypothetical protein